MEDRKREIGYDVIRCAAMLFVIALHTGPKPYQNGTIWQELFLSVFFACNGLFFMLSGRFALTVKLDGAREILRFYKHKLFTLLIPLIFFGVLSYWADLHRNGANYTVGEFLEGALRGVLGELGSGYLWFMFAVVGMMLSAPFLGKMVQNLKDSELHLIAAIGLIWEIFSVYIGKNAGLGFGYSSWFFNGWLFYFFLGYYVYRIFEKSTRKKALIIAGLIAFVINALWTWLMPQYSYNAHDLAPLYTVFVVGFYLLLGSIRIRTDGAFGKIISFTARQSYFVYLLHYIILVLWLNHAQWFSGKLANYLAHYVVCVLCSIAAAFLFHLLWKPVVKKIK